MGDKSGIGWTNATWNPTTGCDRISEGCRGCYALIQAARLKLMGQPKYQNDGDPTTSGPGFALTVHPDSLPIPMRWTKPRMIFVNSMSDLFHKGVPTDFIAEVFAVMAVCPRHTFQVLTKRPARMRKLVNSAAFRSAVDTRREDLLFTDRHAQREVLAAYDVAWPLPNVWLGTSIELDHLTWRANALRETPAAVRFLSCEPLLGPLGSLKLDGIGWVIGGGESQKGARPCHPDWARDLRDLCATRPDNRGAPQVPFFWKQWGNWRPAPADRATHVVEPNGTHHARFGESLESIAHRGAALIEHGTPKQNGNVLAGEVYEAFPS